MQNGSPRFPHRYHRSYTGEVRALIVDLAGTIIDYGSCAPSGAFVELFARQGVTVTDRQAREPMGLNKRDHILALTKMPGIGEQWQDRHGAAVSEADIDRMYEEFIPLQMAVLPRYSEPIEEAFAALARIAARGIPVCATTGYARPMMEVVLAAAARAGFVPATAKCADDVRVGRPAPFLIFSCLQEIGVFPPAAVVNVGDTLADTESGLNAGVWSVGVARTGNMLGLGRAEADALSETEREARLLVARERLARSGAHYVIDGVGDIEAVIDDVNARLARGETP